MAAGVGLALAAPLALGAAASALPLITKTIPSTGEKLPVVGIGTNQFSVTASDEIAARKAVLEQLPQLGGKVVDTAWGYGDSEAVIGKLVKELGNRDKLFFATKTPMRGDIPPGSAVVDQALARLQTTHVDLLQIHNFHGVDELFPVLLEAKQAKKIRYIGATTSTSDQHPQLLEALSNRKLDFIQVDYSIEDQDAEKVLQVAHEKGVAVLINVPLGGRRGSLLTKVQVQTTARVGRGHRRDELGAGAVEIHDRPSCRDRRDTGNDQGHSPRGQSGRRPGPVAGRRVPQEDRGILGHGLKHETHFTGAAGVATGSARGDGRRFYAGLRGD